MSDGTTPFWYHGLGKTWLKPPPEPYRNGTVWVQLEPSAVRLYFSVPHPVSNSRLSFRPIASDVPPTAVTHGSPLGQSGCAYPQASSSSPLSPDEK